MLTGLLFAIDEAEDRHDTLAATLPFGGGTLIEYQARLLVAAGASQIIVLVARLTPALLGALNRIGRHGVAVDAVRTAIEAAATLHPLARVLMLADGLITTELVVASMVGESGDALLVADDSQAATTFERIGGGVAWAGVARLDAGRLVEASALPRDYDVQSALLRVAAQAPARQIVLPGELHQEHGIERRGAALALRGRAVLASIAARRRSWVDRAIVTPLARLILPPLAERGMSGAAAVLGAGLPGLLGSGVLAMGWLTTGLALVVLSIIGTAMASSLAWLRDEVRAVRAAETILLVLPALAVALYGWQLASDYGPVAVAMTTGVVATGALAERAAQGGWRQAWWATPAAYPLLLLPFAVAGWHLAGLAAAWGYAGSTAVAAIEAMRRKP